MPGLTEVFFDCPYCGEQISVLVDTSVAQQSYIEDCEVCCSPVVLRLEVAGDDVTLAAERSDD